MMARSASARLAGFGALLTLAALTACAPATPGRTSVAVTAAPSAASAPSQVVAAVLSRDVDAAGRATQPGDTFDSRRDRVIHLVVTVRDTPAGTKVSYVRLRDGHFVSSRSVRLLPQKQLVDFRWRARAGETLTPGQYTVRVYLNGFRARELNYQVI